MTIIPIFLQNAETVAFLAAVSAFWALFIKFVLILIALVILVLIAFALLVLALAVLILLVFVLILIVIHKKSPRFQDYYL